VAAQDNILFDHPKFAGDAGQTQGDMPMPFIAIRAEPNIPTSDEYHKFMAWMMIHDCAYITTDAEGSSYMLPAGEFEMTKTMTLAEAEAHVKRLIAQFDFEARIIVTRCEDRRYANLEQFGGPLAAP
jgi:hypothetical protein